MKTITFLITLIIINNTFGQDKTNWNDIKIIVINDNTFIPERDYDGGEYSIKTSVKINSINDLTEKELNKIKRIAYRDKGVVVYLDIHKLYGNDKNLFYFWLTEEPKNETSY